jgi:hypothetical protein
MIAPVIARLYGPSELAMTRPIAVMTPMTAALWPMIVSRPCQRKPIPAAAALTPATRTLRGVRDEEANVALVPLDDAGEGVEP